METRNETTIEEIITILSLDYDDCMDLLFENLDIMSAEKKAIAEECRAKIMVYLDEITANSHRIELYVGSNRQDNYDDTELAKQNRNGSCFKNFAALCEKKDWIFRKFLLGDAQNKLAPGTTMEDKTLFSHTKHRCKTELIKEQINDIRRNHPASAHINFHFFDDDANKCFFQKIAKAVHDDGIDLPFSIKNINQTRLLSCTP